MLNPDVPCVARMRKVEGDKEKQRQPSDEDTALGSLLTPKICRVH
jgi:hypothetical protein